MTKAAPYESLWLYSVTCIMCLKKLLCQKMDRFPLYKEYELYGLEI